MGWTMIALCLILLFMELLLIIGEGYATIKAIVMKLRSKVTTIMAGDRKRRILNKTKTGEPKGRASEGRLKLNNQRNSNAETKKKKREIRRPRRLT
mmetsp:Transcript_35171/g.31653  ORF Transcript_35171/g.31653 Transcript_35171/m.31653 type:complete len:96 (+) Transcript_35171:520-807(+)